jgi:ferredoxin-type protein NapF
VKKSINRTQFLRGDLRGDRQGIRPPWAKAESIFTDLCQRCDDCINRCPEAILIKGSGGFPLIDFSLGACTFCRACVEACRYQAFKPTQQADEPAWQLEVTITDQCLSLKGIVCRSCADACEAAAIRFQLKTGGRSVPQVMNPLCTGCGECFAVCPSRAITILPSRRDCAA